MNFITSYSTNQVATAAVSELKDKLASGNPKMVLSFCSSSYDTNVISSELKKSFPNAETFGCTTSGEITSGKMLDNSIVAMGFSEAIIEDIKVEIISDLKNKTSLENAFNNFESHFKTKMIDLDPKKYFGIILIDGLSASEEIVMERISDLTDITFIGGSAGDDLKFKQTTVFANGKSFNSSAVLVIIKSGSTFDFIKTQSFNPSNKVLVATKVDEATRTVIEFDNKPAKECYADILGVSADQLSAHFMSNPLGLMIDNEPYVRSPQQIKDKSVVFYCNIKEGMEMNVLTSTNIIKDTSEAIKNKTNGLGKIAAIINFHCILRTIELKDKKLTEEYGKIFNDIPTIGFSTYGEAFIGHINQTSTMVVFSE